MFEHVVAYELPPYWSYKQYLPAKVFPALIYFVLVVPFVFYYGKFIVVVIVCYQHIQLLVTGVNPVIFEQNGC